MMSGLNRIAFLLPGSDHDAADIPHDDKASCAKRKPEVSLNCDDCGNSNPWDKRRKTEKSITLIENEKTRKRESTVPTRQMSRGASQTLTSSTTKSAE